MSAIVASGVSHRFFQGGECPVLRDVSFEIRPGEIVMLTGPSGSGKTTLLTLIGALRGLQRGSLRVLGIELNAAAGAMLRQVRQSVRFVFQDHNLIRCLTALQNVRIALEADASLDAREANRRSLEILEAVGLADVAARRPRELSMGQQQRVAIARALVSRPAVLLADEPTAALDRASSLSVAALIAGLARNRSCAAVIATHDERIFPLGDRRYALEDGALHAV